MLIIFKDNSLVHQFMNKWNFDNIKIHGTNVEKSIEIPEDAPKCRPKHVARRTLNQNKPVLC